MRFGDEMGERFGRSMRPLRSAHRPEMQPCFLGLLIGFLLPLKLNLRPRMIGRVTARSVICAPTPHINRGEKTQPTSFFSLHGFEWAKSTEPFLMLQRFPRMKGQHIAGRSVIAGGPRPIIEPLVVLLPDVPHLKEWLDACSPHCGQLAGQHH